MAYYADLTKYTYIRWTGVHNALNVGWLDEAIPFPTGEVPQAVIDKLAVLCSHATMITRGFHLCPFCPSDETAAGNGEIRVVGKGSVVYAAPSLLHHYIAQHNYRPPDEFLAALDASPIEVHLSEIKRWDLF